ncbi:Ti-type conjugative transfer relaxase TraA [Phenylobacterium montanum]|uniref:Ti-type conjugative transfer relaxase TraA n=1 Tax=Phenylobacterium montanum TaxID=2823693 RepID=A0A975IWG0_9CAUL|nr:Ti-type conjugative transfer relaxase TraA [Caulobacter sp. S6]QUD89549.1 Ti-type conjugative transfer relaxase TraA [Caulobacter sp. S6]
MAIYHFSAKVISRAAGGSAVAAAAYRSASRLRDARLDRSHDFSNKAGVIHSEVMLPNGAPDEWSDREELWNAVEAAEVRRDAQLAREIEFAIPREMEKADGIELARDFVQREFVERGMVADLNVHWDIGADGLAKPHAHVMLTMRSTGEDGFGPKVRDWNRTALVERWREAWADHVNERLAKLDIEARIDHRSLQAQGIELEPQHKIGPAAQRMADEGLEADRLDEHREIARSNGERIIKDPSLALDAITRQQATFTDRDLAMFVHRHSDGLDQFNEAMGAVRASPDMMALGKDGRGLDRFTSREMLEVEQSLIRSSALLAEREKHRVGEPDQARALAQAEARGLALSGEQRDAFEHVLQPKDLGVVVGYAGTGKSAMLGVAREAWESAGYEVRGLALSGIAAENLESGSGIASRTIASLEHSWAQGRDALTSRDVLVVDEAGMIGSRQMERVLSAAQDAGAKVVLVGDPEQLQAIEAGAAFRAIAERHPHVEITEIRRQHEAWQRDATRQLATGRTREALEAFDDHGRVHVSQTREQARAALVERWDADRKSAPDQSRIILAHTNDDVRELNLAARERLRGEPLRRAGALGLDVEVQAERGERAFAAGDRIMFLKNDRGLGVKNGMLGEVVEVSPSRMSVHLDAGRDVAFDLKDYAHIDHGYAATIHKAQGVTVDRTHVLATPGLDRHGAYVALSRHRGRVDLHYGKDDFESHDRLAHTLGRERAKDMATDFAEPAQPQAPPTRGRSIFAGFKPAAPARTSEITPLDRGETALRRTIERHARAAADVERMRARGLPALAHQRQALDQARDALNQIDRHAARDLEQAYAREPALLAETAVGRTQRAVRVLQLEAEIRSNPALRAERFVERWQGLERQRTALWADGDVAGSSRLRQQMGAMAKSLERDPQVDSLLANRRRELGIDLELRRGLSVGDSLTQYLGLGRGRNIGLGL